MQNAVGTEEEALPRHFHRTYKFYVISIYVKQIQAKNFLSQVFQGMVLGHEKLFNIGIVFIINSISLISLQAQGKEMHVYQKDHAGHKFEKQNCMQSIHTVFMV